MPYYKVTEENGTKKLKDYSKPSVVMPSYIGMLDISTTNSTLAKVQAIYGADTTWIQHSGYMFRAANSNVTANDNSNTGSGFGGSDDAIVVSHSHSHTLGTDTQGKHTHTVYSDQTAGSQSNVIYAGAGVGYSFYRGHNTTENGAHAHNITGSISSSGQDGTGKNIPREKNIYVWERTA